MPVHRLWEMPDRDADLRAARAEHPRHRIGRRTSRRRRRFDGPPPALEIVASFGVGYDHVDAAWAGQHGIVVTHTPDVLNEEVADTAFGFC